MLSARTAEGEGDVAAAFILHFWQPFAHEAGNGFMRKWLPKMQDESRSYVTIAIGCTGGQHRSVYLTEQLAAQLRPQFQVITRHRQMK